MRKALLFMFTLFVTQSMQTAWGRSLPKAVEPDPSVWYYIQVKGEDERAFRVFTSEKESVVSGRAMINSTDMEQVATQLWRFEAVDATWYTIVNKATGKYMNVAYDSGREISFVSLSENPGAHFKFVPKGGGYNIVSSITPQGGDTDEIYLHQANAGGSRDYVIMMVGSGYSGSDNSEFSWMEFRDFSIEYSTDQKDIWYNIVSAKSLLSGEYGITDNGDILEESCDFTVSPLVSTNYAQQWKLLQKTVASDKIELKNRATGRLICTSSRFVGAHNMTIGDVSDELSNGWQLSYLGIGQYALSGIEEDDATRYLNAANVEEQPDELNTSSCKDTGFAWYFRKVTDSVVDHISVPNTTGNNIDISVKGRTILVKGTDDYSVYSVDGRLVSPVNVGAAGLYLVKANGITKLVTIE